MDEKEINGRLEQIIRKITDKECKRQILRLG